MPETVDTLAYQALRLYRSCQLPIRVFCSDSGGRSEIVLRAPRAHDQRAPRGHDCLRRSLGSTKIRNCRTFEEATSSSASELNTSMLVKRREARGPGVGRSPLFRTWTS
jgi:hypothetical protein